MNEWLYNLTRDLAAMPFQVSVCGSLFLVFVAIGRGSEILMNRLAGVRTDTPASTRRDSGDAPVNHVTSRTRTYAVVDQIGKGDSCDVYRAVSASEDWVLKSPRDAGLSRLLVKEQRVIRQLIDLSVDDCYAKYLPEPVEIFSAGRRRFSVFRSRSRLLSGEDIRQKFPDGIDGRHLGWMFNRTLEVLGFVHRNGWVNGAVLPSHLLFDVENHGLQLAGWAHAERIGQSLRTGSRKYWAWYPPECPRRGPVSTSVDIYLAARSMIFLAGGDPVSNRMPARLPGGIRRFLKSCVLDSVRMRPHDAWELREELADVLESIYGPPRFHRFPMNEVTVSI